MLAALSTLAFLGTIWLMGSIAGLMSAESASKIAAAFSGHSPLATGGQAFGPTARSRTVRRQAQPQQQNWRVAA